MHAIEILLVEDNEGDIRLTVEGLQEARVNNNLHVTRDGVEALQFLHREGLYSSVPRPDLILLDLNLPRKDGREVLAELKSDDEFKNIPVVVLTTSQDEQDVFESYDLHANCYIIKPLDFEQLIHVMKSVDDFWLSVVTFPPN
jgi:chemotaxis family two-component system response regulator Rcp1